MEGRMTAEEAQRQLETALAGLGLANLRHMNARAAVRSTRIHLDNAVQLENETEEALESAVTQVLIAAGVAKQARVEAEAPRLAVVGVES